jgi:hypothetical protein
MINGPKWFFEVGCAVLSNFQQAVGKCDPAFTADAFRSLTNRFRDCFRHALSSKLGQLLRKFVRFLVLDVEGHGQPFYQYCLPFNHTTNARCITRIFVAGTIRQCKTLLVTGRIQERVPRPHTTV